MSKFTNLFQPSEPTPEPTPEPTKVEKVVETEKVVPITKASKKKGFTMD